MNVEETIGAGAPRIPQQRGEHGLEAAARYAEERHWDVFAGTWLEAVDGRERCSCGDADCPAPGAHPARPDWASQATGSASTARRMWTKQPRASILLPTGRTFDALDVSESAGFLALARMERMGIELGPITCTPFRRMLFFVLPGGALKVPDATRKLGWSPATLDLVARGEGDYVVAPPTRIGNRGRVQWARQPTAANRWLPDAEELVSALAYACGREAADARCR
ncbi:MULTISPECIES: bifunctional DNA primase/polymerase [Streptomyces]|uniref:Bifunctional DNA primase/polymerase n=1 Tax=Streptomyces morookaense TaxID=1970 RepID=A0A7Y7B1B0_STRMO|nr:MULTISPECIES: bifunctional DNA primase/polymerase [Streptomyces]MCC2278778.1 bifunctional DNA primase/polymerase [Streptomyces sp. ET3-23]NVK77203.1 bifunctional DNA primase/polymerase [Streptomyces morookaense]GHF17539.1 DNA primase [Streptomyces morookaense]